MRTSRFRVLALATAALLACSAAVASADPTSTPPENSIVSVGSQTMGPLFDQLSTDYNKTSPTLPLYNFDATGLAMITTKNATPPDPCANLNRPNGSSQGINAVAASTALSNGTHCMDIATSTRQLNANDPANMAQMVIAQDLISYSYVSGGNVPSNLTNTQLKAIFNCNASLIPHTPAYPNAPVTENEIGGVGSDVVVPVIPQSGSGTRSSWASMQGFSNANPPACITDGMYNNAPIEQNEGTNAIFSSSSAKDIVWPFSGADWVCYKNGVQVPCAVFNPGNLIIGKVNAGDPVEGAAPNMKINNSGFYSSYLRNVNIDFIRTTGFPYIPSNLQLLFGNGAIPSMSWICKNPTAQADMKNFGFALTASCGLISFG